MGVTKASDSPTKGERGAFFAIDERMTHMKQVQIRKMVLSAIFLALGLVLPFLTGQIPQVGSMLLPMHLPVLVCGFVCGWQWGLLVGFITPLLRGVLFGMPPLMPTGLVMAFELAAYGAVCGLMYLRLKDGKWRVLIALVIALLCGRLVWGAVSFAVYSLFTERTFSLAAFWAGGFVNAWPGIVLQLVLVPLVMAALKRAKLA